MSRFDTMPIPKGSRGTFPLNKLHTSTMDFFRWDVLHCQELVADDVISCNLHAFIDGAPNPYPINGHISAGLYAFYVPNRILWKDWQDYVSDLQTSLTLPHFTIADLRNAVDSLVWNESYQKDAIRYISNIKNLGAIVKFLNDSDYPTVNDIPSKIRNLKLSALPLRAANRIWFDWMRDKAHISDAVINSYCKDSGGHITQEELVQLISPKYRLFDKNYITTAFDKPAESNVVSPSSYSFTNPASDGYKGTFGISDSGNSANASGSLTRTSLNNTPVPADVDTGDTRSRIGTQIQDLRSSNSLQTYFERMLVAGKTRMARLRALFGVSPTIEELQMSDYIGGHEENLLFKTSAGNVTSSALDGDPEYGGAGSFGYNTAIATFAGQKHGNISCPDNGVGLENVQYKTDENGYFFVFGCLTPVPQYYQGLDRDWFRGLDTFASDKFDFFHQDFENEGLQPVLNYEVCLSGLGDNEYDPKGVFGFQQKYMDYKYCHDSLGGDFLNPGSSTGMEKMHLGRDVCKIVESLRGVGHPVNEYLTPAILVEATTKDREIYDSKFTFASDMLDHFIINCKIDLTANRPMMQNALPALSAAESRSTNKDLIETSGFRL